MTAAGRTPTYLGGIGTMLSQVEICPNCGLSHSEVIYSAEGRVERGCSRSVMGALPYLSRAWESSAYASPDEVVLTDDGPSPLPAGAVRRYSPRDPPLAVHLPPPPEMEEAFP